MADKKRRPKVKFDASFNFGANVRPKRRTGSSGRRSGRGKWSKYAS
jgi:hypothetical protein